MSHFRLTCFVLIFGIVAASNIHATDKGLQYLLDIQDKNKKKQQTEAAQNSRGNATGPATPSQSLNNGVLGISLFAAFKDQNNDPRGPAVVNRVFPNSPACKAGIHVKDTIWGINGSQTYSRRFEQIIADLHGPVGSTVSISIKRPPFSKEVQVTLARVNSNDLTLGNDTVSCFDSVASDSLNARFASSSAFSDFSLAAESLSPALLKEYIALYSQLNIDPSIARIDSARSLLRRKEIEWSELSLFLKKHPTLNLATQTSFTVDFKGLKPEFRRIVMDNIDSLYSNFAAHSPLLRLPAKLVLDFSVDPPVFTLECFTSLKNDFGTVNLPNKLHTYGSDAFLVTATCLYFWKCKLWSAFNTYLSSTSADQVQINSYYRSVKAATYAIKMYKNDAEYLIMYAKDPNPSSWANYDALTTKYLTVKVKGYNEVTIENENAPYNGRNYNLRPHMILIGRTADFSGEELTSALLLKFLGINK